MRGKILAQVTAAIAVVLLDGRPLIHFDLSLYPTDLLLDEVDLFVDEFAASAIATLSLSSVIITFIVVVLLLIVVLRL